MCQKYDDNIIGQVMEAILEHHKDKDILYTLNEEGRRRIWGYNWQIEWPIQFEIHIVFSNTSISTRFRQHREIGIVSAYQGHWNNRKTHMHFVGLLGLLQRLVMLQLLFYYITFIKL